MTHLIQVIAAGVVAVWLVVFVVVLTVSTALKAACWLAGCTTF